MPYIGLHSKDEVLIFGVYSVWNFQKLVLAPPCWQLQDIDTLLISHSVNYVAVMITEYVKAIQ